MIKRFLCRLGIHYFEVIHNGTKFVSHCRWCQTFERRYEP